MEEKIADDLQPENILEEWFPPRPGGMVDRHRRAVAERKAREAEEVNESQGVEQRAYRSVKTAQQSPEILTPQTFTIQPGGYAPVLPLRPYRYRATLLVITSNATVILAKDQGAAISANGFTLPYGIPFPVFGRAQLYAYNNTGATAQVSVMGEEYAPEDGR